jgi:two-component system KDP operon response regulator KdpE
VACGEPCKFAERAESERLYVAQQRRKLEPVPGEPRHFLTELGMGYRYEP